MRMCRVIRVYRGMDLRKQQGRDRKAEAERAHINMVDRVSNLAVARHEGTLGLEYIKLAQAMLMCGLPYSQTSERQVSRRARLGDGSFLDVTFSALLRGVPLPYGADRKLLAWLLDRAIRADSPFVPMESASEYLHDMGITVSGRSNQQLAARFERLAGLDITIQRKQLDGDKSMLGYRLIAESRLPSSVGKLINSHQPTLPGMENRYGIRLSTDLYNDVKQYNVVLPRLLWRDIDGPAQVQDITLWLLVRCYAAASETIIPWEAFREQFGAEDSNPWRIKSHIRRAVLLVHTLWPEAAVSEDAEGVRVGKAAIGLLPDDGMRGRTRRLK